MMAATPSRIGGRPNAARGFTITAANRALTSTTARIERTTRAEVFMDQSSFRIWLREVFATFPVCVDHEPCRRRFLAADCRRVASGTSEWVAIIFSAR